ncbi:drug/metabolite transporter (DMT)-like permease [Desulfitispora alkaliphila]|uniref:DMT family transporter n=1 Tax=Desulfitispora alkaliphila TaxID=622674 RepID=UPI003D23EACB
MNDVNGPTVNRVTADCSLLLVTLVWGLTFVTVKNAVAEMAPHTFNFFRFTIAAIVLALIFFLKRQKLTRELLASGTILGIFLFGGYSFQTVGLQYTTASNAGFITGLAVVIVPLIMTIKTKKIPNPFIICGVMSATFGLGLLTLGNQLVVNLGDILMLFCALSFALHIVYVGKYASKFETVPLVLVQIIIVALLSGIFALFSEPMPTSFSASIWQALLITALLATCLAFFLQNYMQKFTTPTRTAIIFTMEPVFAAFFAVLLLQEILTSNALWGGAFVIGGMLISELNYNKD